MARTQLCGFDPGRLADRVDDGSLNSWADGIEETSVQGLIAPPSGPILYSALGDIEGFVHNSLTTPPTAAYTDPKWSTCADIDYAGLNPAYLVRIGTGDSSSGKQVALSFNSGASWSQHYGAADNVSGGKVALSADGTTVLWSTSANGVQVSANQATFTVVSSLPSTAVIASDKKTTGIFYGASGSSFYVSIDNGNTFSLKGSLGSSSSPVKIVVHPNVTGDIWVSSDAGLYHSTNSGATFDAILGVTQAWAVALGAPAKAGGYPAVFAAANIGNIIGYFRSDDQGVNWVQINDAAHGFGSASANVMAADLRTYGRVYIGTNGRGIFYGDISGTAPPNTATPTSTPASSTTEASSTSSKTTTSSTTTITSSATSTSHPTTTSSSSASSVTSSASTTTGTPAPSYGQCGGTL
ncbi:hypothetical protein C0989_009000 [Termitomyces sp. Mn162]|nr:hypothetical protein C0989_009000 [Termitomyces sp. Mn162]